MQTTIVIPCYNEAERLNKDVFLAYLDGHPEVGLVFVNDGSSDRTLEMLMAMAEAHPQVHYLDVQPNGGKAEAVRRGMLHAAEHFHSEYIGFWDADLATPLYEIDNFLAKARGHHFDMITGLRLMRLGAQVSRKSSRHYLGRVFATAASVSLKLPVYDTQCGAKMFVKDVVEDLFRQPFVTNWLFDVELFARYVQQHGRENAKTRICEYPLQEWKEVGNSRLKLRDFAFAPYKLFKIKRTYKL